MARWSEGTGEALGDLLSPLPDTQRIFLRQSNGAENADTVGDEAIGQESVITRGNDTGAFGKCAPTSYFCAAICGIGTTARDGLAALFGTSVLPAFRRRGIQTALIAARLERARQRDCTFATIHSRPGIPTERNAKRMGFALVYTKAIMTMPGEGLVTSL